MASSFPVWLPARGITDDDGAVDGELTGILHLRALGVPKVIQSVDHLSLREALASANLQGAREDSREHSIALAMKAGVDHLRELHVVVACQRAPDDEQRGGCDGRVFRRSRMGVHKSTRAVAQPREQAAIRRASSGFRLRHLEREHPVMTEVEGQFLHEPLDERRAVTVEQRDTAERAFLRDAVGKRLRLRAVRTGGAASRRASWQR